jgi:CO/xanthine dehydrogenase FAD-binding subunit
LLSDIHGAADYRANLIKVMAQRAVAEASIQDIADAEWPK